MVWSTTAPLTHTRTHNNNKSNCGRCRCDSNENEAAAAAMKQAHSHNIASMDAEWQDLCGKLCVNVRLQPNIFICKIPIPKMAQKQQRDKDIVA